MLGWNVRGSLPFLLFAGCLQTPAAPTGPIDAGADAATPDAPGACLGSIQGGTHEDTRVVGGELVLAMDAPSGTWTSEILGGDRERMLARLDWTTRAPYGKPLPDDGATESGYAEGNVAMTGNVLLLHLDEGPGATTFIDDSGAGNHGTCFVDSCPTRGADGPFAHAIDFEDDLRQGIVVPASPSLEPDEVTVAVWMRPDGPPWPGDTNLMAIGKGFNGTPPYAAYSIEFTGANQFRCYATWDDGGVPRGEWVESGVFAGDPGFTHVACVKDLETLSIWVNGQMANEIPAMGPLAYVATDDDDLHIGSFGFANQLMNGAIDEVAIWNRPLEDAEIAAIYRRGALRLSIQVRTCDEPCTDELFHGPGDAVTFWSESCFEGNGPPSLEIVENDCDFTGGVDPALPPSRYAQLQVRLSSPLPALSPALRDIRICE